MISKIVIGDAQVVSLGIGCSVRTFEQVRGIFPDVDEAELKTAVGSVSADNDGVSPDVPGAGERGERSADGPGYRWCFNAALIRIPGHTILVDTGFGFSTGGPGTALKDLLSEASLRAEEVDRVFITHGHGDHVGGLLESGRPTFPSARMVMARKEYDFWTGPTEEPGAGSPAEGSDKAASPQREAFEAYEGRIDLLGEDRTKIAESGGVVVRSIPAPGHTPGHTGLEIAGGGRRLWLLVDTLHTLFQLAHTDWSPRFDGDPAEATGTRKRILRVAADEGIPVHFYHLPFPGFGTIRASDEGYSFQPLGQAASG